MNARIALLAIPLLAFPVIALAQATEQAPPPEVDKALRARATEFFDCYVSGDFRKAFEMVAEDTKDQFFNGAKNGVKSYQLGEIKYSDNFTKAEVQVKAVREMILLGERIPTEISQPMTFKVENGKWVWYYIPTLDIVTPMGVSHVEPGKPGTIPTMGEIPKDFTEEGLRATAAKLLGQVSIDKTDVTFPTEKASEAKVVFHNGMGGPVQVQLAKLSDAPGFSAKLDKTQVDGSQNAVLTLNYDPTGQKLPEAPISLRLVVTPTNQAFVVVVRFLPPVAQ